MKQRTFIFLLVLLSTLTVSAQTLIDGIYYSLNSSDNTAAVTSGYDRYTGSVTIPETVTYNGVPYSVTTIKAQAFFYCIGLTSVEIPNSVTSIEERAFSYCYDLASIEIPSSVTSIGNYAFENCSGLKSVTIPNSTIGYNAFNGCSKIETLNIDCEYVNSWFGGLESLTSLNLGNHVKQIGYGAFNDCSGLTSLVIPNSVTSIGQSAFEYCTGLKSLTIGSGVTSIGSSAFERCSSLTSVTCEATSVPTTGNNVFAGVPLSIAKLTVPSSALEAYMSTEPWSEFGKEPEGLAINETNFPDENFRNWLLYQLYGADGYITDDEIAEITSMRPSWRDIESLKGIEYFTELTLLDCEGNQLKSLDVSVFKKLQYLYCSNNQLTSLDVSACTGLIYLSCNFNKMETLNIMGCTELYYLYCTGNPLTSLDVSGYAKLKYLDCRTCNLTSLRVSGCPNLNEVYCCENQIKGAALDALLEDLPTKSGKIYVLDDRESNEQNVITSAQVAAVKAKGWTPYGMVQSYDETYDMYYYEWKEISDTTLRGDVNGDGVVNGTDIQAIINFIVAGQYDVKGDVNEDGNVNGTDIQEVINVIVNGN